MLLFGLHQNLFILHSCFGGNQCNTSTGVRQDSDTSFQDGGRMGLIFGMAGGRPGDGGKGEKGQGGVLYSIHIELEMLVMK